MPDIERIDSADAPGRLAAQGPDARGFLGLDPHTQNDALLAKRLRALDAHVFSCGDTLLGYAPGADNPRQATIAASADDPLAVAAFTAFLHRYRRYTSFVATAEPDGGPARALRGCGFAEVARMPGHVFRSGRYRDVAVYYATWETTCGS